jgi:type II secretory pathway component PulJ
MTNARTDRLRRRMRRAAGTSDAGFTLLEALVSFVVFATVLVSASVAIVNAMHASHITQERVQAADQAQAIVAEAIRKANTIAQIPPPGETLNPHIGDNAGTERTDFKVVETVVYDNGGSCDTGTMFTVNVEVYLVQTGRFLARSDARVACPRV